MQIFLLVLLSLSVIVALFFPQSYLRLKKNTVLVRKNMHLYRFCGVREEDQNDGIGGYEALTVWRNIETGEPVFCDGLFPTPDHPDWPGANYPMRLSL